MYKTGIFPLLLLLLLLFPLAPRASGSLHYTISNTVDTSDAEKNEVIALWLDYLSSQPDSIRFSEYWNTREQQQFRDFDFARQFLYPDHASERMERYMPEIVSVDRVDEGFLLKTRFNNFGRVGDQVIRSVNVVSEDGKWKFANPLAHYTRGWSRETVGYITFVFPSSHIFNKIKAGDANRYYTDLANRFGPEGPKPFEYYIGKGNQQLGMFLGMENLLPGAVAGMAMSHRGILLSGNDSEWYPHELAHMIFVRDTLHEMMNEGFASWHGGTMGKGFDQHVTTLNLALEENPDRTFFDVLGKQWGQPYAAYYITGGIILAAAYDLGGNEAVKKMLRSKTSNRSLVETMYSVFGLMPEEIDSWWKAEIKKRSDSKT